MCDCAIAERDRGTSTARILFNADASDNPGLLETWLSHEIVHTAGQFSSLTGVDAICGAADQFSMACVKKIENQIDARGAAYREQNKAKDKKPDEP